MKALLLAAVVAMSSACSSSSTTPGPVADSGPGGTDSGTTADSATGADASTDGGFDFTFTNSGGNLTRSDFRVAPVMGSFCMGTSAKQCSFTGSITTASTGCTAILNVAFVGSLGAGGSFPIVADSITPPGKGEVSYTETCTGGATKMWKATGGTLTLTGVTPPPAGLTTGSLSLTVDGATMTVAPAGAGDAQGSFSVTGHATNVGYTSSG